LGRLGLHLHGGLQAIERIFPALLGVAVHLVAAHRGDVLLGIQALKLPIQIRHVIGQASGLVDQPLRGCQIAAQPAHHAGRQARQIASLVHQHLGFVLELLDLVVDLLQGADRGQRVLHEVRGVDHDPLRMGGGGAKHGRDGRGNKALLHGWFSSG
jgi:hypothetical protein